MSDKEKKLEKLIKIFQTAKSGNRALIKYILDLEDKFEGRFPEIEQLIERLKSEIGNIPTRDEILNALNPYVTQLIKDSIPEVKDGHTPTKEEILALIRPLIVKPKDGKDGQDGKDGEPGKDGETPDDEKIIELIKPLIPEDKTVKDKLKDLERRVSLKAQPRAGWGAHPLKILDEGVVVDKVARIIDFVGSGVSVARSTDGTNTVTIPDNSGMTPIDVTGTYNATQTNGHYLLNCDASGGAVTINMPTAVSNTAIFKVHKLDSSANTVTVDPDGSEQIKGDSTLIISYQFSTAAIVSDNAGWVIV